MVTANPRAAASPARRAAAGPDGRHRVARGLPARDSLSRPRLRPRARQRRRPRQQDRKSTRLNSSHGYISYAVFCLKKKKKRTMIFCLQEEDDATQADHHKQNDVIIRHIIVMHGYGTPPRLGDASYDLSTRHPSVVA